MKIKKIIAVAMCMVMTLLQFQTIAADTRQTETCYYVSADGNDSNVGTSASEAFATVKKAVEAIEAATEGSNTIKIVGDYTLTNDDFSVTHTKAVVIEGNNAEAKLNINDTLYAGGPFTFQNITIYYETTGITIYMKGQKIVFGEGVKTAGNAGGWDKFMNMICTGGYADAVNYSDTHKLTINDGDYYRLYVGDNALANNEENTIPGFDFIMNGGSVYQFILGGDGWDGRWGTNSYTSDVNLTFNDGTVGTNVLLAKYGVSISYFQSGTNFNGHALQIIMNNGKEIALDDGLTAANVESCNGSLYVLKCAAQAGSTLETTATAGIYKVNGDMVAVATDGTSTYTSDNGKLTVPKGTYNVSWKEKTVSKTVYVSADGSDENEGTSVDAAFKTVKKAVETIEAATEGSNTIKIVGDYTLTNADFSATHTKAVVIEGNNAEAKLNINDTLYAGGPFTFQNIIIYYETTGITIYMKGQEIVFGEGVKTAGNAGGWDKFMNMICTGGYADAVNYSDTHKLTINDGDYYRLYVGDNALADNEVNTIPGFDFIMNGGSVYQFILGGDGWDGRWGTNSYTSDVNLTFNEGTVGTNVLMAKYGVSISYFQSGTNFNGHALQIIMNNGKEIALDDGLTAENVESCNGSLYVLKCAAQEGSTLETTATAGVYKVNGSMAAVATDGTNTYKSVAGQLVVPKGTYTVTWTEETIGDTLYVSATGSDSNSGTASKPLKTISAAINKLNSVTSDSKAIVLIGEYELESSLTLHADMITIRGNGEVATQLKVKTGCDFNGPITLESVAVNITEYDKYFNTCGNKLVIGANVTSAEWRNMYIHMGTYSSNGGHEETVINSGTFTTIAIGSYYNSNYSYETAGADLVVNDGTIQNINVFADGWLAEHKGTTFTDNVNLTFNGGSFGQITLTNEERPTTYDKAVQIILNDVSAGTIPAISSIQPAGGYWIMRSDATGSLAATGTAGEFTVNGGMTAIATAKTGGQVYISENGLLKVPAAGEYDVTYSDKLYYANSGDTITFYEDCNLELSGMKHTEKEGQLFVGWVDVEGNGVTGTEFTKDTVLTAKYVAFDKKNDFAVSGKQLKKVAENEAQTLRFQATLKSEAYQNLSGVTEVSEVGGLAILSDALGTSELTVENGTKTITNATSNFSFHVSGLEGTSYKKQYTVKGYISYTDLNGYARVLYTDYAVGSVYGAAKDILARNRISDKDQAYFDAIKKYAEVTLKNEYLSQSRANVTVDWPALGITNPYTAFYTFANGLTVREVDIDAGFTDGDVVEVVQATDFHFNYCNAKDFEENNPSTMSTYLNRGLNPNGSSAKVAAKCMEYGSLFDQTVVTGDILDYMSWGGFELMQKYIWDPYPDTLALLGNHDPVRVMGLPTDVPDPTTAASRFEILQQNWKHDIYYTSRLIKNKVLVIQMDNGQNKFWDSQVEKLQKDLARAKENGYTVLIFLHVPLSTGDSKDVNVPSICIKDPASATLNFYDGPYVVGYNAEGATKQVYDLITNNADVIKGVFTGHEHNDFYAGIKAKTSAGEDMVIPQYSLAGSFYDEGHVLKINVK